MIFNQNWILFFTDKLADAYSNVRLPNNKRAIFRRLPLFDILTEIAWLKKQFIEYSYIIFGPWFWCSIKRLFISSCAWAKKTMNVEAFFVWTVRLYCLYALICFWILFNEKRMRQFDRRRNIHMKFCGCLLVWREKESKTFIHASIGNIYWKLTRGGAVGLVVTTRLNGIGELHSNSV